MQPALLLSKQAAHVTAHNSFERWRGFKSGLPERSVGVLVRAHLVVRMSMLSVVITDGSVVQLPQSAGALWRLEDPQSLDYRV